jgi:sigma-E factor negative regulatory protein RseB
MQKLLAIVFALLCISGSGIAQAQSVDASDGAKAVSLNEWLVRIHEASKRRAYTGTFVVSTAQAMSSARIWHVCDGLQQVERVDALTGPPRTTVRRNDDVMTFLPDSRTQIQEKRNALGMFPALLQTQGQSVGEHYLLKPQGLQERVAGWDADVFELQPKDDLRFGYRVWVERKTGLVLKLQTLDAARRPLEQVAFSELNLNAPLRVDALLKEMKVRAGYVTQKMTSHDTTPEKQGWRLRNQVPGFQTVSCQVKSPAAGSMAPWQWVLSDGLTSVSVFIEKFQPNLHVQEGQMSTGATHTIFRREGEHWLTVIGEVPVKTLVRLAGELERLP